tara:strand:- start:9050 stop:9181 length:132 start_codon:yes stop_codon:yes gene_type:complete
MPIWKYKKEKDEVVAKLFEDDDKVPSGWKDSPKEAGKKVAKQK